MEDAVLPIYVQLYITDSERKIKADKTLRVSFRLDSDGHTAYVEVPVPKKVDNSDNNTVHFCPKAGLLFNLTKDGRINASGRISRKRILEIGHEGMLKEFADAAEKLWSHANTGN